MAAEGSENGQDEPEKEDSVSRNIGVQAFRSLTQTRFAGIRVPQSLGTLSGKRVPVLP